MEVECATIGLIQWYHLRDSPESAREIAEDPTSGAGMDLFVVEAGAINRGIGSRVIEAFVTSLVFREADVTRVVAGPARTNARSIRAFEKAGFKLARIATVNGEPIPAAVMLRDKVEL